MSLFERLKERRPPPTEEAIKQPRRRGDPKTLLMDVLTDGPVPATLIKERGAARGFSRKQLYSAKRQMSIVAFKEEGKLHGRWFWALPQHAPPDSTAW